MSKHILLVVDMQNDFIDGKLGTPQAQAIVENVAEKIKRYRKDNALIVFTKDTHDSDYLTTQEGKRLPVEHCIKNTYGWEISNSLDTSDALLWDKITFASVSLARWILRTQDDVEEIEIVGLCTDVCVISNALVLKAFVPEATITVDARCCAGITNEAHKAALIAMKSCQVNIINGK